MNIINKNNLFVIVSVLYITLTYLTNILLNIDKLTIVSFSNTFTYEQIEEIINFQKKWQWASYLFIPIILFIKTTLVASVLYIGAFFYSKIKVTFKQLWHIVVKSELVFLGVGVLKIVWFYFFQTNYTLEDLQYFYPLSALNIVGYKGLEPWYVYPLQTINLFEVAYWFLLAYYIGKIARRNKNVEVNKYPVDFGLKIVAASYGSALLLWVVVVMFFTLNYS